ncbi:SH3-like domain-containing protein [Hansschlegelia plantiphila]|uniref:Nitrile hydratase beta subunit domain-containing protein n=1 Tax=Hansschlegelia plantiphila TaxID=374655 RepID=A0A9W6J1M1_9HYPH|nr:hypothetical protein GCM10008179_12480 [Hansschlegelia plantiphila]
MPTITPEQIPDLVRKGASCRVDAALEPLFKTGDKIRALNINPATHTRLPRYIRGKEGVIDRDHGVFVFPDTQAEMKGAKPQHVYSVRFTAQELWGADAPQKDSLYIDLFEDYMEKT